MKSITESIIGRKGIIGVSQALPRKENLEEGDIVLWRSGDYKIFLIADFDQDGEMRTGFYEDRYLCDIAHFDDNLKCSFDRDNDVIKIFKTSQLPDIYLKFPTYTQNELERIIKTGKV